MIERASPSDVMELDCDVTGTSMQVAAVLVFGPGPALDLQAVRDAIAERSAAVPRMRQRLVPAPFGCGRPVWVDDGSFDIRTHVTEVTCPPRATAGGTLLGVVADLVTRRLPLDKPLWTATLVRTPGSEPDALLVVFHHALADGMGGLAMLAHLVDGLPLTTVAGFPRRPPAGGELWRECWASRVRSVRQAVPAARRLRSAAHELKSGRLVSSGGTHAPHCSLNDAPVGTQRALATIQMDLAATRRAAHAAGGTVNDVLLAAVAGALGRVLADRGEDVGHVVISIPVSSRQRASATDLGNQVGVIPVEVPTTGDPAQRLRTIARITAERKTSAPGSSAALIGPVFRLLAKIGVFGWFIGRQRLVNTFVTNLRGPESRLTFLGADVEQVIALPMITGNISVAFAALSYAGTLTLTVIADPDRCPDLDDIAAVLRAELVALTGVSDDEAHTGQLSA